MEEQDSDTFPTVESLAGDAEIGNVRSILR
jgi:hypothetical protein